MRYLGTQGRSVREKLLKKCMTFSEGVEFLQKLR